MRISDWSSDVCSSDLAAVMPRSHMPIVIHAKAADPKIWELLSKGGASSPPWTGGGAAPPRNLEVETGCRHERPRRAICGLGIVDRAENPRPEERRVGQECVSPCRSRGSPYN